MARGRCRLRSRAADARARPHGHRRTAKDVMAVIGITPNNRLSDYLESVKRAGGEPRVLSMDAPPTLDGLDGVLFTGGGDVDPAHYRDARHPNTNEPDAARDAGLVPVGLPRGAVVRGKIGRAHVGTP